MRSVVEIEQLQLMQILGSALFTNIFLDRLSVSTIADGGDVVPIGPEFSAPELLFYLSELEARFCRESFEKTDDLSTGVCWEELAQDVKVILIESDLMDIDGKPVFYALDRLPDRRNNLRFQDCVPVLDRKLDMVIALRNIVVPAPDVFGNIDHAKTLYLFVVCVLPMVPALRLRAKRRVSRNQIVTIRKKIAFFLKDLSIIHYAEAVEGIGELQESIYKRTKGGSSRMSILTILNSAMVTLGSPERMVRPKLESIDKYHNISVQTIIDDIIGDSEFMEELRKVMRLALKNKKRNFQRFLNFILWTPSQR